MENEIRLEAFEKMLKAIQEDYKKENNGLKWKWFNYKDLFYLIKQITYENPRRNIQIKKYQRKRE